MKPLKEFLHPNITIENTINIALDDLHTQGMVVPNKYYVVLDETTLNTELLIKLKLILLMDSAGEYFLIAEESSKSERWNSAKYMRSYYNSRIAHLHSMKRNIIVTSDYLSNEYMFIQFYVIAGHGKFDDIMALVMKIEKQIKDFRKNYKDEG